LGQGILCLSASATWAKIAIRIPEVSDVYLVEWSCGFGNGSARGNGRAFAIALARVGSKVFVADVIDGGGLDTVEVIRAEGRVAEAAILNVRDKQACATLTETIRETFGSVSILINIASIRSLVGADSATYSVSKGTIRQVTKAMSVEVEGKNGRGNAIVPGVIETEMTAETRTSNQRLSS